ncbi:hypothetical protein MRX96_044761 [Rhipicephalus microplus]
MIAKWSWNTFPSPFIDVVHFAGFCAAGSVFVLPLFTTHASYAPGTANWSARPGAYGRRPFAASATHSGFFNSGGPHPRRGRPTNDSGGRVRRSCKSRLPAARIEGAARAAVTEGSPASCCADAGPCGCGWALRHGAAVELISADCADEFLYGDEYPDNNFDGNVYEQAFTTIEEQGFPRQNAEDMQNNGYATDADFAEWAEPALRTHCHLPARLKPSQAMTRRLYRPYGPLPSRF